MHGSDTVPGGYAALRTSRGRAEAQASEDEPEPDWNALRAQAEAKAQKAPYKPPRPAPERVDPVAEARALCAQAQAQLQAAEHAYQHADSDDEAELAAQHYEQAHAQLDYAQHLYEEAQQAAGLKAPRAPVARVAPSAQVTPEPKPKAALLPFSEVTTLPFGPVDPIASVFASPSIAPAGSLDTFANDDYAAADDLPPRRSRWLPKLMAAVAVTALGVGGVAFAQFRAAEAERTARAEKLLQEMRQADAAREAEAARQVEAEKQAASAAQAALTPQAQAPTGESVAAALAQAIKGQGGPSAKASPAKAASKRVKPKRRIAKRSGKKGASKAKEGGDSLIDRSKDPLYGL